MIVTYESEGEIRDLLGDLRRVAPGRPVVVVDNASRDATAALVRSEFPEVTLIVNAENVGFARAVNQGFEACRSHHVFLLNPDMRIQQDDFHGAMMQAMEGDTRIAAVGPLQYKIRGNRRDLTFTWSYLSWASFWLFVARTLRWPARSNTPIPVAFLNAGCLLLRRTAFVRVGRFSEKYFLYGEEPDLFLKFARFGLRSVLHPGVGVLHYRERSLRRLPHLLRWRRRGRAVLNVLDALVVGVAGLLRRPPQDDTGAGT